jgi:hypothetical protein
MSARRRESGACNESRAADGRRRPHAEERRRRVSKHGHACRTSWACILRDAADAAPQDEEKRRAEALSRTTPVRPVTWRPLGKPRGSGAPQGALCISRAVASAAARLAIGNASPHGAPPAAIFGSGTVLPGRGQRPLRPHGPAAFAAFALPRPALQGQRAVVRTDGYPKPPGSVLARHARGRRTLSRPRDASRARPRRTR